MNTYNTVIVGGGAGGILSGIYLDDGNSVILEKNDELGRKILLTGGGRCNLTNNSTLKEYIQCYYNTGKYYRKAFSTFFNRDIIKLLEDNGCKTKTENDNRVFPESDNARDVVNTLTEILENSNTQYKLNSTVKSITRADGLFRIVYNENKVIESRNIILATGGNSYPKTGSAGDGKKFAVKLGHTKTGNMGGLCPIKIGEKWIRRLQGISVDVSIEIKSGKKSLVKTSGSVMFTHNGLSGFAILDSSMIIEKYLHKNQNVTINLDFIPDHSYESLDKTLRDDFDSHPTWHLKRYLHKYLPKNMVEVFLEELSIQNRKLNQVTRKERILIRDNLKRTVLTVTAVLENESMVTNSGIKQKEINPDTFESRIVPNLYIVGELVEGCGICGGYNLQKAFSTGVLAASSIKKGDKQ